ncbi:hypothetical protein [Nocardia sp. NPDC058497]|uniref:hypothetical protein n=1 Tax=Nocardia sp. NPDC058497 TaxID=3346529 RepID=UPI00365EA3C4
MKVHDQGEDQGRLWIAMELVDGVDLAQRLQTDGPLSAPEVVGSHEWSPVRWTARTPEGGCIAM